SDLACDYSTNLNDPDCPCSGGLCDPVRTIHGGGGVPMLSGIITTNAGKAPRAVAMGDFNNDGYTDLAVANEWSNNVHVALTNSGGSFLVPVELPIDGSSPNHIAVGDFNGDGIDDIAVSQHATNLVTVLLSNPGERKTMNRLSILPLSAMLLAAGGGDGSGSTTGSSSDTSGTSDTTSDTGDESGEESGDESSDESGETGETGDCDGNLGCPCGAGGFCANGLACLSDVCVEDPAGSPGCGNGNLDPGEEC